MRGITKLLTDPTDNILLQMPRALVASGLAAGLDVGIMVTGVEAFGLTPPLAAIVGYLAGVVLQYVLCQTWVFRASPESNGGFAVFALFSLVGLGITWGVLATLSGLGGFPYPVAKVVALGLAFSWNFLSRKWLLFRSTRSAYEIQLPDTIS